MRFSELLNELVSGISEENYEQTLSDYRLWMKIGATHGWISDCQLENDIKTNMGLRGVYSKSLVHPTSHLLLKLITDVDPDQRSSVHTRLCRSVLKEFFTYILDLSSYYRVKAGEAHSFYTSTNLLAHWANLGYLSAEDVRDHILQSLTFRLPVRGPLLYSLLILFRIAGATFAAYADPSLVDHCFSILKTVNNPDQVVTKYTEEVLKLRESGWKGLPSPPTLIAAKSETTLTDSQDPVATPIATSLGLPGIGELSRPPTPPSPTPDLPSGESRNPSTPLSPSTSVSALSEFTIADSLDDEPVAEPDIITPHDTFYLDDGSVEIVCGTTLFRVHTSTLSFHSPVLRQMFSSANLAAADSPNQRPRIISSDMPADFAALLKAIYLPGFPERSAVLDFITFSSLLRVSTKYQVPKLRAHVLETIRDTYPENFEGLDPSKTLGECGFSGPMPHPNAVLNLFIEQRVESALPLAYYMAVRRGLDSLMDTQFQLPGPSLKSAMRGLIGLREMELKEMHQIIFAFEGGTCAADCSPRDCSSKDSRGHSGARTTEARQRVFDRIVGPAAGGTRILQVLSIGEFAGKVKDEFCRACVERMQATHADMRRRAWAALPEVFGLRV